MKYYQRNGKWFYDETRRICQKCGWMFGFKKIPIHTDDCGMRFTGYLYHPGCDSGCREIFACGRCDSIDTEIKKVTREYKISDYKTNSHPAEILRDIKADK